MTPDTFTNQEFWLDVGNGHQLYVHDWGNKDVATPIVSLHGGPGGGARDRHKGVFDPSAQRVIFFDQRGCGRSTPYGSIEHNTTKDCISDIEKIREHLDITEWMVTGGSWGSCLSLAYAIAHPKPVKGMVISGVFTGSQAEIDWLDNGLFKTFYPDVWAKYLAVTPKAHHKDPMAYHYANVMGDDRQAALASAYAYDCLEGGVMSLDDRFTPDNLEDFDPDGSQIEMYYMRNRCFMPDRFIFDNAHKLTMPVKLIQGRYDMVCPPATAYELAALLPNSDLVFTVSGHRPEHETWNLIRQALKQLA